MSAIRCTVSDRERVGDDSQLIVGVQQNDGAVTDCVDSVLIVGRSADGKHDRVISFLNAQSTRLVRLNSGRQVEIVVSRDDDCNG